MSEEKNKKKSVFTLAEELSEKRKEKEKELMNELKFDNCISEVGRQILVNANKRRTY
jgi:protein subunit release factor B